MPVDNRPRCSYCRERAAEAFLHGNRIGEYWFICFDCIEAMIDRENAVYIAPELRELLPGLFDRPPQDLPPVRRPPLKDEDYDKLRALRQSYINSVQAGLTPAPDSVYHEDKPTDRKGGNQQ